MFANCEGATDEDWQIVLDNMGLVYHCLNRMGGFFTDRDREDAEQDGIFGLLRAAHGRRLSRGDRACRVAGGPAVLG